jgi:ferredoxin
VVTGPLRILADRERCVGSGMCVVTEPRLFDQNEHDGRVELLAGRPGPDLVVGARDAVDLCPAGALSLVDG